MRVEAPEERQILSPGRGLMRLALLQNALDIRLQNGADRGQTLLCRARISISQGHSVKLRHEIIGPFDMLGLMIQQHIVCLIVKPLNQSHEHISRVIECTADLRKHERRCKREPLCLRQVVDRPNVERARLGRELLGLDVWNILKSIGRNGRFPQPREMVEKVSIVLGCRLLRLLL